MGLRPRSPPKASEGTHVYLGRAWNARCGSLTRAARRWSSSRKSRRSAGLSLPSWREHLVHGDGGVAVAGDALLVPERLGEGLAEGDGDVLHRVVCVDVQVAVGADGEVDASVLGQGGQHVVVEAHARADVAGAG